MTTLATMKARVANELARDDLTSEIASAITEAIDHYKWRRFWFNEEMAATSSTVQGTELYSAPAPFLSVDYIRGVRSGGASRFEIVPRHNVDVQALTVGVETQGQPFCYSQIEGKYRFWPIPDAVYDLTWSGLVDVSPASDNEADNPWMTYGESLIRNRAKAYVSIGVLRRPVAIQEAQGFSLQGLEFLSVVEKSAFTALQQQVRRRTNTGRIRPRTY